jgi:hypothetical protein
MRRLLFLFACLALLGLPAPAQAAFPVVSGICSGTDAVSDTTQVVGLDCAGAFGTISAGNLLIVVFHGSGTDATPTSSCPEFTQIIDTAGGGGNGHSFAAYKFAEGDEGTSMNCTSEQSETSSFVALRITGAHASTAPEGTGAAFSATTAPNPPSETASWGAEDNLWIVTAGVDSVSDNITAYPANYGDDNTSPANNGGGDLGLATRNDLTATATEDPGAFTSDSSNATAQTIVVRPAAAAGGGWPQGSQQLLIRSGQ